jgi:hypothetical protein
VGGRGEGKGKGKGGPYVRSKDSRPQPWEKAGPVPSCLGCHPEGASLPPSRLVTTESLSAPGGMGRDLPAFGGQRSCWVPGEGRQEGWGAKPTGLVDLSEQELGGGQARGLLGYQETFLFLVIPQTGNSQWEFGSDMGGLKEVVTDVDKSPGP